MDLTVILAYAAAVVAFATAATFAFSALPSLKTPRGIAPAAYWSFVAGMAVLAVESLFAGLAAEAVRPEDAVDWQNWRLSTLCLLPGLWLAFSLSYARGNYQESLRKWRVPLLLALVVPIGLAVGFRVQWTGFFPQAAPGTGRPVLLGLTMGGFLLNLVFLVSAVLILMNLERTYRASVGTMRWRIKYLVLGLGLLFAARAYSSSQNLVLRSINLSLQGVNSAALLVTCGLLVRWLPRVGQGEVSVYPSKSVLHSSLTLMVAGAYLVLVGVVSKVVAFFGGDADLGVKALVLLVALAGLTAAALSDRVQLYTKGFVGRHFRRAQYDYRKVWQAFTAATEKRVEQKPFCEALAKLVSELFQALSVTVWLVEGQGWGKSETRNPNVPEPEPKSRGMAKIWRQKNEKEGESGPGPGFREEEMPRTMIKLAASTSLSQSEGKAGKLDAADAALIVAGLSASPEPVDMDASRQVWAAVLRRLQPDEFRKGGNRICVPLQAEGELLGIITLGDRVAAVPYSAQDMELLKAVADQAAARLSSLRLTRKVSEGMQLDAFRTMSAFFVHDLKNTASRLAWMLQNLQVHFEDPAFKADALAGISDTVKHINEMIGHLGLLRQQVTLHPGEADLNELVEAAVKGLTPKAGVELVTQLEPVPKLSLDVAQMRNVVTNLLVNAQQAVGGKGQVRVGTGRGDGWVTLTVSDNGCGMAPEFVEESLFRPFQTTKKDGIGIGMFQCKLVVEAHRGRIEVESEPGKGTEFRVLLPMG